MSLEDAKVLVVDDDPLMRRFITITLNKISVRQVREVPDGLAGLEAVVEFQPNVVLSDVNMFPIGGMEFVRRLRELPDRELCKTPVIMLSADENEETFQMSVPLGIFGHLAKPPNATALEKMLNRALKFKVHA